MSATPRLHSWAGWLMLVLLLASTAPVLGHGTDPDLPRVVARNGNGDLGQSFATTVNGGVAVAGVGLRATGTARIRLRGVPPGATITRAFLYFVTMGSNPVSTVQFADEEVPAPLVGTDGDTCWRWNGVEIPHNFTHRVDVTDLVSGNGNYLVAGLPADGVVDGGNWDESSEDSQGAALVVVYARDDLPLRHVVINDGTVAFNDTLFRRTVEISGFAADTDAEISYLIGDAQGFGSGDVLLDGAIIGTDIFTGSDGPFWDTVTLDVSGRVTGTSVTTTLDNRDDCIVWAATVLSVASSLPPPPPGGGDETAVLGDTERRVSSGGTRARVAVSGVGDRLVVWTGESPESAFGQFFDENDRAKSDGTNISAELVEGGPIVAVGDDDVFLVGWQNAITRALEGQLFDADGQPRGLSFVAQQGGAGIADPQAEISPGGAFAYVWQESGAPPNPDGIFGTFFDPNGDAVAAGTRIDDGTGTSPAEPALAGRADGTLFVVWRQGPDSMGSEGGIFGKRYDAEGNAVGDTLTVDIDLTGDVAQPEVASNSAGDTVVAWRKSTAEGEGLLAQRILPSGELIGSAIEVDEPGTDPPRRPVVAVSRSGGFVVLWERSGATVSGDAIWAQFYDRNGQQEGEGLEVAVTEGGAAPRRPDVAVADDDSVRIAFQRTLPGGVSDGIFTRTYRRDPEGDWMALAELPDFRFKARITSPEGEEISTKQDAACIPETLCVSGAIPDRSEVFVRVVGPKPNGYLWPTLVKFSTSRVEIFAEQISSGDLRSWVLAAAAPEIDELPGLFDRTAFLPAAEESGRLVDLDEWIPELPWLTPRTDPPPPSESWFSTPALPGFRFQTRITSPNGELIDVRQESACIIETLCVSGAVPGRSEVFVRVVGPKPNGYLWPTLVKFTTSQVEIWIEQTSSGGIKYYLLPGATPEIDDLLGLFDRFGFLP